MLLRRMFLATGLGASAATLLATNATMAQSTPAQATPGPAASPTAAAGAAQGGPADDSTTDWANITYTPTQIANRTWMITGDASTSYLLAGDSRAILIDTGMGAKNVRQFAESLLGGPVTSAINTHGHWDHTGGNQYFDVAYMSREAELGAKTIYPSLKIRYSYNLDYPIHYVQEGTTIDLGNRVLSIFSIPSHSPGDIAILDKTTKSLFSGDNVNMGVNLIYQQTVPQPYIELYADHIAKLMRYTKYFTEIYAGHASQALDTSVLQNLLDNANQIMAGTIGEPDMPNATSDPDVESGGDKLTFQPHYKYKSTYQGTFIMYDQRFIMLP